MSQWQFVHLSLMFVNGSIAVYSGLAIDRAKRNGGWHHGGIPGWRIVAALNVFSFGLNGIYAAVLP